VQILADDNRTVSGGVECNLWAAD